MRILVLEDTQHIGLFLTEELMKRGYSVDWAGSLRSARQMIEEYRPSVHEVAILDYNVGLGKGNDLLPSLSGSTIACMYTADPYTVERLNLNVPVFDKMYPEKLFEWVKEVEGYGPNG